VGREHELAVHRTVLAARALLLARIALCNIQIREA
jgi:hypothetical protein